LTALAWPESRKKHPRERRTMRGSTMLHDWCWEGWAAACKTAAFLTRGRGAPSPPHRPRQAASPPRWLINAYEKARRRALGSEERRLRITRSKQTDAVAIRGRGNCVHRAATHRAWPGEPS
jgi:hypothetical protein